MSRPARYAANAVGLGLIVLVLYLVGLNDRVVDADGIEHVGQIVERGQEHVVLRTDEGRRTIAISDARAVRGGLRGAFKTFLDNPGPALLGLLAHLLALGCTFFRWGLLLFGARLETPWRDVVRLSWIGVFFASVVPGGIASGDAVKSVYIARTHSDRRTRSVVTVLMDRVVGLAVLCLIATVAVLVADEGSRVATAARTVVLVLLGVSLLGGLLLFCRRLRELVRLPDLLARMPFGRVVEEARQAMAIYGSRPGVMAGAALISLCGHAAFLLSFYLYASAMGTSLPLLALCVAIPVAQMLAAVPGLPGGWGVGDFAMFFFLPAVGVEAGLAVALSFTWRLAHTLLSLPGGLMLARHGQ